MKVNQLLSLMGSAYDKRIIEFVVDGDFNLQDEINPTDANMAIKIAKDYAETRGFNYLQSVALTRGKMLFMGLTLFVKKHLVSPPSLNTEILVNAMVEHARGKKKILEIGTGSGAIALAIASQVKSQIAATDISSGALGFAQRNAKENGLDIEFLKSDMFKNIGGEYGAIVANFPCSSTNVIKTKPSGVPDIARDGGHDGLKYIKSMISDAPNYLESGGVLGLKLCYSHTRESVPELIKQKGYKNGTIIFDAEGERQAIIATI
jgi:release factor glutamine methyltransferase